ncbi:hypothetical protein COHA_008226 [Chlorella ohadii]|uniref:Uncharacterized protein n=1 Tax=Chlorella ohadii TaxID=2649997 RepID=A0AAD5GZ50_9CHLO|nr:hypothetical protein COHA_008226 [Chlorella ohadii]
MGDATRERGAHRAPPAPRATGDERQAAAARDQAPHGGAGVDRLAAAQREIMEMKDEKAGQRDLTASDDEWQHMPVQKKWFLEFKNFLYSWLGTGVEPL